MELTRSLFAVRVTLLWAVLLLSSAPARAFNFTVTSLADGGPGSLRVFLKSATLDGPP